jgi:hypothetical protein
MSLFFVRVELHGGSLSDYTKLHEAMATAGFSRTVVGNDGRKYNLPTAEYTVDGNHSIDQVSTAANVAATKTGRTHIVLASMSSGWKGSGMTVAA